MTQNLPAIITAALGLFVLIFMAGGLFRTSKYPHTNPPGWFQVRLFKQMDFIMNGKAIFLRAKKKFGGKPFRMLTEVGTVIVLPPSAAQEIRNEKSLSFGKAIMQDFHAHVPGFEPFGFVDHDGQIMQSVIRKQLTKYLNKVTEPLSKETTFAVRRIFGDSPEWHEVNIKDCTLDLVSRISSRVFLGEEVCRNEAWLKITKAYTVDAFKAAVKLTLLPSFFKPLAARFSKDCNLVRQEIQEARDIITPVLEKRRALKENAKANGEPVPTFDDAIDWAENEHDGTPYDPAIFQLVLSFAAIHTTTDLTCQVLLLLAQNPEAITPLREEIIKVLKAEGWRKSALYNMKLLDSAIKEGQRIKPAALMSMRRLAEKDMTLSDGTTIHAGDRLFVDTSNMVNPEIHAEPEKFDIYRFLRMREDPNLANKAQLVTTSPDHMAFGHGLHACPGRFFAANEVKVALCHLLLKYDWKWTEGTTAKPVCRGLSQSVDSENRLLVRRRKEEIDMETLEFGVTEDQS